MTTLPDRPGLGIDVDWDRVIAHRVPLPASHAAKSERPASDQG
jgi:hypothetical protein